MALQASSKVKGITIEIGADTSKFGYEMNQIKKEAQLITKDMKSVDEAMKLDPTNIGKAADKLKLLREQADNATKKVNTIKAAIDALNKEYQDKSSKEYTEQLEHLERQLESATREQEVANARLKDFETSADSAGKAAVNLGDLIKGNVISRAIMDGLQKLWDLAKGLARELIEAGKELFNFSKESVSVAAQYQDALGYSEKVFGGYSETVREWVKENSEFLRINISDLQVYANNLGTAFNALGLKKDEAVEFTQNIMNLSADLRAATGQDIDEIVNALTRGFTSSTRNLRRFGLFVSEADIKIQALKDGVVEYSGDQEELNRLMLSYTLAVADAEKALDTYTEDSDQFREAEEKANEAAEALNAVLGEQEITLTSSQRTISLYNLIMERLSFVQGQNAEEAKLYNSQLALLKTKFANLKLEIGNELLPVFTDLVTAFNDFLGSEEGKKMLSDIVDQFSKWADTVKEWVESGQVAQFFSDMGERVPQVVETVGDFVNKIIELVPEIEKLVEALLKVFGIETEAEKTKRTFLEVKDSVEALANQYGISVEEMNQAVNVYAESAGLKTSEVYENWNAHKDNIARALTTIAQNYDTSLDSAMGTIQKFSQDTGISLDKIFSDWGTYEPKIGDYARTLGKDYEIDLNNALEYIEDFAENNGLTVSQILSDWQTYEPDIKTWLGQMVIDAGQMSNAWDAELDKLPESAQQAIRDTESTDLSPLERFLYNVGSYIGGFIDTWTSAWNGFKNLIMSGVDMENDNTNVSWGDSMALDPDFVRMESTGASWKPYTSYKTKVEQLLDKLKGRSLGGRGYKGFPYLVGDDAQNRPEIFVPDSNGTFVNGDSTERVLNNINNSRSVGNVTIYVTSTALSVDDLANDLGEAMNRKLRMSGAIL